VKSKAERGFLVLIIKEGEEKSKKAKVKGLKAARLIVSCFWVLIFTFS
jgi:hypothetical protein